MALAEGSIWRCVSTPCPPLSLPSRRLRETPLAHLYHAPRPHPLPLPPTLGVKVFCPPPSRPPGDAWMSASCPPLSAPRRPPGPRASSGRTGATGASVWALLCSARRRAATIQHHGSAYLVLLLLLRRGPLTSDARRMGGLLIEVDKRRSPKRLRVGVMEADRRLSPQAWVGVGRGGNGGVIEVGKRRFP